MDDLIDGSCSTASYNGIYCSASMDSIPKNNPNLNPSSFDYASTPFMETSFDTEYTEEPEETSDNECALETPLQPKESANYLKSQRKNLIIWDWDDTIFPTYSFRCHHDKKDGAFMDKLQALVDTIHEIFSKMIAIYGANNIVIITNGSENWIHKCLNVDVVQQTFMKFQRLLLTHNITTISASTMELRRKYPMNPSKWKEVVFANYFLSFFGAKSVAKHLIPCITSIGDSSHEYKASDISSKYLNNRILNRILLKSNPSIDDLVFELKQILRMTQYFNINVDDIDLDFSALKPCVSSSSDTPAM